MSRVEPNTVPQGTRVAVPAKTKAEMRRAYRKSALGRKLRQAMLDGRFDDVDKIMEQISNVEQGRKRRVNVAK